MQLFKSWMPEFWLGIPIRRIASEIVQQPAHFGWFFLAVAPLALWGAHWWTGALAAAVFASGREFVDQWPVNLWWDTALDWSVCVAGGALAGALLA